MIDNKVLTYISLFSSAGVGCFGFKQAGFECVATNEIIPRRLEIQKINHKCKFESGYILGDIKEEYIKNQIFSQITKYKKLGNDKIDVLIATPPCQGMSVANHKKNIKDTERNSLVVESVELINKIKPRFFIFENVFKFLDTACVDKNKNILSIKDLINQNLSSNYSIYSEVINFKNYGSNSSRTRTLVVGVCKELSNFIAPFELFPNYQNEKKLKEVIGTLKPLKWGEIDKNDFYHAFRTYDEKMRNWIKDLKQGQSAFDNVDINKKPHQIINGEIVLNQRKNGDKYTRQDYDKVAPCIHTRNDQLASQNTIHPKEDRVFSIRELMLMMEIPKEFKWIDMCIDELNSLSDEEKYKLLKKNEINIRQSIGEAVPTIIFRQIAQKIANFMSQKQLSSKEISILTNKQNLLEFLQKNKEQISISSLSHLVEYVNNNENSAYFTNKFIINEIIKSLPTFDKERITIIEPSVGSGNFLPAIFKKYENIKNVDLKIIDINQNLLDIIKILYEIPSNFNVEFICNDFMNYSEKADLIVGNPPFTKMSKKEIEKKYQIKNSVLTNLAGLFMQKATKIADFVSLVMPKNLLNTDEYKITRDILENKGVMSIIDFGELGFSGVLIETINIVAGRQSKNIKIKSLPLNIYLAQDSKYIFDKKLPYWVIYRDSFFDNTFENIQFNIFESFRDRQLTNSNTLNCGDIRIIKSRNIDDKGTKIIDINGYDSYILKNDLSNYKVSEFLNRDDVYLVPNMTYNPRIIKKEKGYITNGSVAILIPKCNIKLSQKQMEFISSPVFRKFYKIARNYQTRTLNIDNSSVFWFGAFKG